MPYLKRITPQPEPVDCRILTAALNLFVERGYHNVSVHDVQKQANVSIGSIYNHFGGKEGIAKALYYHLLNEIQEMVDSVLEEKKGSMERCNRIIELLFEYTETHRNIISYIFHAKHREFLPDEPPICNAEPFRAMREIVHQGIADGEIRDCNLWVAAASVFGGALRMVHLRLDGVIEEPLPQFLEEVIDNAWQGMQSRIDTTEKQRQASLA